MKKSLMTPTGLFLLAISLAGTGCAPLPYQGPCSSETEVIIIYEPVPIPVPYPVPVEIGGSEPLPPRHKPLTKPRGSGNPRIKTPRGGQSEEGPVIARGGDRPARNPGRAKNRPTTQPGTRGR